MQDADEASRGCVPPAPPGGLCIPLQGTSSPDSHVFLDVVDSTMAEAFRRAKSTEHDALWIVAKKQISGRGRRGRPWVSEPGNLYATLLLRDPAPPALFAELCFVSGIALHEAIGLHGLRLKWPNDLLSDDSKLAGILIEAETTARHSHVAIGFGVNCTHHPADAPYPVTNLAELGASLAPEVLFARLAAAAERWLARWKRGENFATIRESWLQRARGLGAPIRVRLSDRIVDGVFDSLDAQGRLMLRLPSGVIEPIAAGEIFFDRSL